MVAAAQRLGGVERAVLADGHEGVLQSRARGRVRMDVARGHAGDAEPVGERGQAAVERAVVAMEGALQLDAEGVAPEGAQQPPHRRLVADPLPRAAAEADQALGVGLDVLEGDARIVDHARGPRRRAARAPRPLAPRLEPLGAVHARVSVRAGEQPAEVGPPASVAHEQGEVARIAGRAVDERHLGAVDRAQATEVARRLRELHRARDRVVVGEGQRRVAALQRRRPPARRAARRRPGRRRRSGSAARRMACEHMFACREDGRQSSAGAMSVWLKSPPLKSRGLSAARASA